MTRNKIDCSFIDRFAIVYIAHVLTSQHMHIHTCDVYIQVALQLENKFGKPFAQQARSNMSGTVNPKVSTVGQTFLCINKNFCV